MGKLYRDLVAEPQQGGRLEEAEAVEAADDEVEEEEEE